MLPALPNNNNNSQNTENEPVKHDNVSGKQNIKDNSSKAESEPKSESKSEKTNKSSGSENKREESFFAKMFNDIEKTAKGDKSIINNKQQLIDFLSREDKNVEMKRQIVKISNNTDIIIEELKRLNLATKDKKDGFDWTSLLPALLPLIAGALGALMPEAMKPFSTLLKSVPEVLKSVPKVLKYAEEALEKIKNSKLLKDGDAAATAIKTADAAAETVKDGSKIVKGAETAAETVKDGSKIASIAGESSKVMGALATGAKALGKVGSAISDNPIVNKAITYTGIGMTAGRALEGDYLGAAGEATSLALHSASTKAKGKTKSILTAMSLGTDVGLLARDYFKGTDEEKREEFAKQNGFEVPEKESAFTKLAAMTGIETEQAKKIKSQNEAMTDEQKGILATYDAEQDSGIEKIKNMAVDALPAVAMTAMPLVGTLFKRKGTGDNTENKGSEEGSDNPVVDSGNKFHDIIIKTAKEFSSIMSGSDSGSDSNGSNNGSKKNKRRRNRSRTAKNNRSSNSNSNTRSPRRSESRISQNNSNSNVRPSERSENRIGQNNSNSNTRSSGRSELYNRAASNRLNSTPRPTPRPTPTPTSTPESSLKGKVGNAAKGFKGVFTKGATALGAVTGLNGGMTSLVPESLTGIGGKAGTKALATGATKLGGKLIPGVGLAMSAGFAADRVSDGDYVGAAGEVISGLAGLIPGIGTAAAVAIQGGLMYRDSVNENNEQTKELNTITKDSTDKLNAVNAEAENKLIKSNEQIDSTNTQIVKNSDTATTLISKTGSSLASFTSTLGSGITDWLLKGGSIFGLAFKSMELARESIGAALAGLKNLLPESWQSVLPDFLKKDGSGGNGGNGGNSTAPINYKLDTGKGEYDLGKHGGTMTSSIMKGESGGNYGIYNGSNGGKGGTLNNANTSVDQIISAQNNKQMNAFGAYQIIGDTMKDAKVKLGLKGDEKMTAALQDKIYQEYLIKRKRPAIFNYITGKASNINTAVLAGAMEWASIGVPHDMDVKDKKGNVIRRLKKGQSYYAGIQGNAASITPEEFAAGLSQQRERYLKLKQSGLSEQDAYTKSFKKQGESTSIVQSAGQIIGGATEAVKTFFGKDDKQNSKDVITKTGNVIPATLAKPTNTPATQPKLSLDPSKKGEVANIVKQSNNNKQLAAAGAAGGAAAAKASNNPDKTPKVESDKDNKKASYDWDLDKLATAIVAGAKKSPPYGDCALYVRRALEKAQTRKIFSGGLGHANQFAVSLPKIGWVHVGQNLKDFKKGDIAVFPKSSNKHNYGHVCVFTGSKWVSDFVQMTVQPNSKSNWPYNIYRAKSGYSNGSAVTAVESADAESSIAKGAAAASLGGSETSGDSSTPDAVENKDFISSAKDALTTGIAALATFIGNSDFAKYAVGFVKNAKVDDYKKTKFDDLKVDTSHVKFDNKEQGPAKMKYKFGNGGDYNEDELFNPNLGRQQDSSNYQLEKAGSENGMIRQLNHENKKLLENAGYVSPYTRQIDSSNYQLENAGEYNGMKRQEKSKVDWMENAGYIPPNVRQGDSSYSLKSPLDDIKSNDIKSNDQTSNTPTIKKKKLKWYEKLFGGKNTVLFSNVASAFGFGDIFNLGKEIYDADKSDNLKDYGINKALDYMSNNSSMSNIGQLGKEIYVADKSGNLKDYGINKALDYMTNNSSMSNIGQLGKEIYAADKSGNLKDYAINKSLDYIAGAVTGTSTNASNNLSDPASTYNQNKIIKNNDFGLFTNQPKSIIDTINEQNKPSIQYKSVDNNLFNSSKLLIDNKSEDPLSRAYLNSDERVIDNKLVKQVKNADGSLSNKYVNPITGEVTYKNDKKDIFAGTKEDNSDNEKLASYIQKNGPLEINPVSSAFSTVNSSVNNHNQIVQPQLNDRGNALMNLVFKDNANEKGAVMPILNGVYGMSERIKSNPRSSKTGWGGLVNKSIIGFSDLLFGGNDNNQNNNPITGFNPNESIQLYNHNSPLVPNNTDKTKVNGYIASVNQQYQDMKENKTNATTSGNSNQQLVNSGNAGSAGKKSNLDGMSTNIVTRNPDSIFRSVSMTIMKTTLT